MPLTRDQSANMGTQVLKKMIAGQDQMKAGQNQMKACQYQMTTELRDTKIGQEEIKNQITAVENS